MQPAFVGLLKPTPSPRIRTHPLQDLISLWPIVEVERLCPRCSRRPWATSGGVLAQGWSRRCTVQGPHAVAMMLRSALASPCGENGLPRLGVWSESVSVYGCEAHGRLAVVATEPTVGVIARSALTFERTNCTQRPHGSGRGLCGGTDTTRAMTGSHVLRALLTNHFYNTHCRR